MIPVVTTIEAKCKRCYSCVRNCPARAIRVDQGQAQVLVDRCIACGYCVKVCSQNAKKILDGIHHTRELIQKEQSCIAILAPSFPAAFPDVMPQQVIAGIRKLGFSQVMEVAFGADLVGQEYKKIMDAGVMPIIITSPCPAIVNYIEKYFPDLTLFLAPVVSPMIAMGRVIKHRLSPQSGVVFIGPCIAKKKEMKDAKVENVIDEVLTFQELQTMFDAHEINLRELQPCEFDGPQAGLGRAFPLSGGLLRTAAMGGDILDNDIVVTEGRERVMEVIKKVHEGRIEARFLDLLFCEGCVNGPKIANDLSVFVRKDKVVHFIKDHFHEVEDRDLKNYSAVNLRREFTRENLQTMEPSEEAIKKILAITDKFSPEDELNCGSCGYATCREKAAAVIQGLAEAEMCLPFMIERLNKVQRELTVSNSELRNSLEILQKTQQQLLQSEKLASVGQLAAGVAHELNNPLGGIMIYSSLLLEKAKKQDLDSQDLERIVAETDRCRKIVRGLLDFSRQTRLESAYADLNKIIKNTLALVARQASFLNIRVVENLKENLPMILADVGQIQQVLLNIILNAAESMSGKGRLTITTDCSDSRFVVAHIEDTGTGMPKKVLSKIFDPFYTTKPHGKGTGLGLAVAYGIIQKHNGEIFVESQEGAGSKFTIKLPVAKKE